MSATQTAAGNETAGLCGKLGDLNREVKTLREKLIQSIWKDKQIHTGPARRHEIALILSSGLSMPEMVEVLDTLLHRYVTELTRRFLMPGNAAPETGGGETARGALTTVWRMVENIGPEHLQFLPELRPGFAEAGAGQTATGGANA